MSDESGEKRGGKGREKTIRLPPDLDELLVRLSEGFGVDEEQIIIKVLRNYLRMYDHVGAYDPVTWDQKMTEAGEAINKWDQEHPDELKRIVRIGMASFRKRHPRQSE